MPEQVNFLALQSDETALFIRFREDDRAKDDQVVIDVEIGGRIRFEQSLIVAPNVEKLAVDFDLGAGDAIAVDDFVQVFEDGGGRNVADVRGNGSGFVVTFESKNPKRRAVHR